MHTLPQTLAERQTQTDTPTRDGDDSRSPAARWAGPWLGKLSPGATKMIRMDHAHVMMLFHQFHAETAASRKQALIETACLGLEIHATLEEEIFYPALRAIAPDHEALQQAPLDHAEMKALIGRLRQMPPEAVERDATFLELMRDVIHHMADEETLLLPLAEQELADQLDELGVRMTRRRIELSAPRAGEIAMNSMRTLPPATLILAGGMLLGGYLLARATGPRR